MLGELASRGVAEVREGAAEAQRFVAWLCESALPLWASHAAGDRRPFAERLDFAGAPVDPGYLRLRVIARQVAVYSQAADAGIAWARPVALRGWDALRHHYWAADRGWHAAIDVAGRPTDDAFTLYDQAFAVYACASLARLDGCQQALTLAGQTLDLIDLHLRDRSQPGWSSNRERTGRDQNGHLHFLEALLALHEVAPSARTEERINEILQVAGTRLYQPACGAVAEWFDLDWALVGGEARIEPGHQYEWFWLLSRAAEQGFRGQVPAAALFRFAECHGWDRKAGLVVDACAAGGQVLQAGHRLWPHCEAIRALSIDPSKPDRRALIERQAGRLFETFLAAPIPGTWIDRLDPALLPAVDHVPASSLYHLWEAGAALVRAGLARWPDAAPC